MNNQTKPKPIEDGPCPHFEMMEKYVNHYCKKYKEPWKFVEIQFPEGNWQGDHKSHPLWHVEAKYRFKPETHIINGFEVPLPLSEAPKRGEIFFTDVLHDEGFCAQTSWDNVPMEQLWLSRGLVHATKEGAIANCKARLGIDPFGDKNGN